MPFEKLETGVLDCFSSLPVEGSSLEVPKSFWRPGSGAIYNAYTGKSSLLVYGQGAINVGMNPTNVFAYCGAPGNINYHRESITTYVGDHRVIGRSSVQGIEFRTNVSNLQLIGAVYSQISAGKVSVQSVTNTNIGAGALVDINASTIKLNGRDWDPATKFWDSKKNFDIPHPTKKDHRLRYVCLEGPSADVFVRGRLKDSNVIKLPNYWKDLVDEESITVELQPIGSRHYHLNVEKFNNKEIHIKESDDKPIDCFYHVYGERKDTTKNIPEYKGLTIHDYPGDNRECRINSK